MAKEKEIKPYVKHKFCPKCGPGVRLADHGDRYSCGKCGYTEMKKQNSDAKKQ